MKIRLKQPSEKAPIGAESFRSFLQTELASRCQNNPSYSLRAFAYSLRISPSTLSRILRSVYPISNQMKRKLGTAMGLSPDELARFKESSASEPKKHSRVLKSANFHELQKNQFEVIAGWQHYAILELQRLHDFDPNPRWIAKKLKISINEVSASLERLCQAGLIQIAKDGTWRSKHRPFTNDLGTEVTTSAKKRLQKQIVESALSALDEIPIEFRDQSSMTMAIRSDRLKEAITKIAEFRQEFATDLCQDKDPNAVYQLSVSFFPITPISTPIRRNSV